MQEMGRDSCDGGHAHCWVQLRHKSQLHIGHHGRPRSGTSSIRDRSTTQSSASDLKNTSWFPMCALLEMKHENVFTGQRPSDWNSEKVVRKTSPEHFMNRSVISAWANAGTFERSQEKRAVKRRGRSLNESCVDPSTTTSSAPPPTSLHRSMPRMSMSPCG